MKRVEHYVTLFDSHFLPQGLALHASLSRHAGDFVLWVLCMDERCQGALEALNLPTIRTIALRDVESPELLRAKTDRTRGEYCWTITCFTPDFVFKRDASIQRVTYVDADIFLLKSPEAIFCEFEESGKSVLITDHAYDAQYDQSSTSGKYCVQFMIFERGRSAEVLDWWQQRCLEWCYARVEDGKFGDQKYLDDWPVRFGASVHVLHQIDAFLAPWNARRFPYSAGICWHFHGLRILPNSKVLLHGPYSVPDVVHRMIYAPYIHELKRAQEVLGGSVVQARPRSRFVSLWKALRSTAGKLLRDIDNFGPIRNFPE